MLPSFEVKPNFKILLRGDMKQKKISKNKGLLYFMKNERQFESALFHFRLTEINSKTAGITERTQKKRGNRENSADISI